MSGHNRAQIDVVFLHYMIKYFFITIGFLLFLAVGLRADQGIVKHFKGVLNKKLTVYMRLTRTNDSLHGDYIYLSQGKPIALRGAYKNNHFVIFEFTDANFTTMNGKFEGDVSGDTMKGIWRSMADPNIGYSFTLIRSGSSLRRVASQERLLKPYETADSVVMVDSYYPMLTQLKNYETSERVNRFLNERLRSFKYDGKMPMWDNLKDSSGWFTEVDHRLLYITDNVASFSVDVSEYTGGAHPNYGTLYLTLDLNTGKQLTIKDCLNTSKLKALNKLIEETAATCAVPDLESGKCLHITPEETNFSISPEGLKLFQDQCYSHASLACAFIEIQLPKLKKFIKSSGAFKELR